jgi:hypothetical protein
MHRDQGSDEHTADLAFERLLLQSARHDDPTEQDARRVWSTFSASMGAALSPAADAPDHGFLHRLRHAGITKFVAGALAGSALTALWFNARPPVAPALPSTASAVASTFARAAPPGSATSAAPPIAFEPTPPPKLERPRRTAPKLAPARTAMAGSTLAAEIEALDEARALFAAGRYDRVSSLMDGYRRRFPAGQLAPEAEALAIEALDLQGDRAAAVRRAEGFLERYPNDPHAARITAIVGRGVGP